MAMGPYEVWRLIERVAKSRGVKLWGPTRYDDKRHVITVVLERRTHEVSVYAIEGCPDPVQYVEACVFRMGDDAQVLR